jgi:hypothetical protein
MCGIITSAVGFLGLATILTLHSFALFSFRSLS